jgi:hypothetical protein
MPSQSSSPLLIVIAIIAAFPILLGIRRRREGIRYRLRRIIIVEGAYLGLSLILLQAGRPPIEALLAGVAAALVADTFIKRRSRYIPAAVRRNLRAEYEMRTGKKFNSKKYELDHKVPFSRGGSHTEDNLRVLAKSHNRSKGAKSVWWDLLGR